MRVKLFKLSDDCNANAHKLQELGEEEAEDTKRKMLCPVQAEICYTGCYKNIGCERWRAAVRTGPFRVRIDFVFSHFQLPSPFWGAYREKVERSGDDSWSSQDRRKAKLHNPLQKKE